MARRYWGDIEGKFWLGVQPSDASEQFGGQREEIVRYYFDDADEESCKTRIKEIEDELGDKLNKLKTFFDSVDSYSTEQVMDVLGLDKQETLNTIGLYADLGLGRKILKCIEENGFCEFEAEQ